MKNKIVSIILILVFLAISTFVMLKTYSLLGFSTYVREIPNPYIHTFVITGIQFAIFLESLILVALFAKVCDKEKLTDVGIQFKKMAIKLFCIGMVLSITAAIITWITFLLIHNPHYSPVIKNIFKFILLAILVFPASFFQGTAEEILTRTWMLKKIGKVFTPVIAIFLVGLIFGLLHFIFNPKYTVFSSLNTAIVGWVASYVFFKTKSVWIPAGIHVGWNYFLGIVYGKIFFHVTLNGTIILDDAVGLSI